MTLSHSVYVIGADGWPFLKIGMSNSTTGRLRSLNVGSPARLRILAARNGMTQEQAAMMERCLHAQFRRARKDGEWFELSFPTIREDLAALGFVERAEHVQIGDGRMASADEARKDPGGRPKALADLDRAQWAQFDRDWKDDAVSIPQMARKWKVSAATISRKAAARKLGAKV